MISAWRDSSGLIHPNVTEQGGFVQLELLYSPIKRGKQLRFEFPRDNLNFQRQIENAQKLVHATKGANIEITVVLGH